MVPQDVRYCCVFGYRIQRIPTPDHFRVRHVLFIVSFSLPPSLSAGFASHVVTYAETLEMVFLRQKLQAEKALDPQT